MDETSKRYATQSGRGRKANDPRAIPWSGWKDVIWRLYHSILDDHVLLTAAGVTFYVLLALVPTLTAFVAIYGLFNDPSTAIQHVELLAGIAPPSVLEVVRDQMTRLTAESGNTLGLTLLFSLVIALWSAGAGVRAIFEAMNVAYNEPERRSLIAFNVLAFVFTVVSAMAALFVVAVVVVMPMIVDLLPGDGLQWTVRIAAYIAMLFVVTCGLAATYRWGPSREDAKWRWITPGTILSLVALCISSVIFSWYAANFTDNSATYGSLGAIIGLMTWVWISVTLVIIGAELNSEIEHQTAQDTTTGLEQPMGERGAYMADHVGRVRPTDRDDVEIEPRGDRPRKKFSLAAMAFAIPAAAALHLARRSARK